MSPFVKGHKHNQRKTIEQPMKVEVATMSETIPTAKPEVKRVPLGTRSRLTYRHQDPNYVYRWVNDQDERLQQAQEASYDYVRGDSATAGESRLEATALDGRISKPVGNGVRAYLMRIHKDFYIADQKAKQGQVDLSEVSMKPDRNKGQYGPGLTND
jgi:hypothetical protein